MLIVNRNEGIERSEIENEKLRTENERMKAVIEYIGALDYPEILEEEEDHE